MGVFFILRVIGVDIYVVTSVLKKSRRFSRIVMGGVLPLSIEPIDPNPQKTRLSGIEKEVAPKCRNFGSPIRSALITVQAKFRGKTTVVKTPHFNRKNTFFLNRKNESGVFHGKARTKYFVFRSSYFLHWCLGLCWHSVELPKNPF